MDNVNMSGVKQIENDEEHGDGGGRVRLELYDWLQCIVAAVLCAIFVFIFLGRQIGVEGPSMMDTLVNGDRVVISNLFYTPDNDDIVVFRVPAYEQLFIKRVIAVAGETVDINFDTGEVTVDGVVINEPYIKDLTHVREDFTDPVTVPEGYVFVMGDNRNNSLDSRSNSVGLIDTRYILGKVLFLAIPGKNASGLREWSRVGSVYG